MQPVHRLCNARMLAETHMWLQVIHRRMSTTTPVVVLAQGFDEEIAAHTRAQSARSSLDLRAGNHAVSIYRVSLRLG